MSGGQASVHIDLDAVAGNFRFLRALAPRSRVMAIVKADAYGHGAVRVAQELSRPGQSADAFGVARMSEAMALRDAGVSRPISLLEGVSDREELALAVRCGLQPVVHSDSHIGLLRRRRDLEVWIKVDTGMGRLGFAPEALARVLREFDPRRVLGLMTHLADAGDPASGRTRAQIDCLNRAAGGRYPLSIGASAGVLGHPDARSAWVRPGLMLYGASPMDDLAPLSALRPAMSFAAPVIAVRQVRRGDRVGYGGVWAAPEDGRIAVVAAGYADGYPREISQGAPVLLHGARRPIVGRVSMDMLCVALAPGDAVSPGDRALLWGQGLPVEEICRYANTIPWTLMSGVSGRVQRLYQGGCHGQIDDCFRL